MNKELLEMLFAERTESEIRAKCQSVDLGFDIEKASYPLNPFSIDPKISIDEARELLDQWKVVGIGAWDSVWESVEKEFGAEVIASVADSVMASVGDSFWDLESDAIGGYISSIFYDLDCGRDFSAGSKLWEAGYVASYDGTTWRLHAKYGVVLEVRNEIQDERTTN